MGLTRYASSTSVVHTMPELLLAAEKEKPAVEPAVRPIRPCRLGPCLWGPPCSTVWHCEHLVLKIFAPFLVSPAGASPNAAKQGGRASPPGVSQSPAAPAALPLVAVLEGGTALPWPSFTFSNPPHTSGVW